MNTKFLMTTSASILAAAGIILTFMPDEILTYHHLEVSEPLLIFTQMLGALYFAFGMLNWMSKANLIGGIYNRPIAVANFTHFFVAGLALLKRLTAGSGMSYLLWIVTGTYFFFAVVFGLLLFRHPIPENKSA